MKTTANLGFKNPEGTDVVNIDDLNYNADIADTEIVKKASSTQDGRMAKEDKVKLDGISAGANKVEQSSTNGNIKINGTEKTVYTHPGSGTNPHGTTKSDVGLGNVTNDAQVKRTEMGTASGVATLDSSGVNAQAPKVHIHTKSQISDFPTSLPANGGTSSACSGNAVTATKLQTARKINGVAFDGSSDITITASANGGNSTTVNSHTANGTPATTEKTDIIKMINEVFQSGTNVKADAISAVNSKGGSLGSDATWDDIIAAINAIARGQGNAVESQVLSGATFSNADGVKRTGTMPNKGAVTITPSGSAQTIPAGYHNGSGKVSAVTVPIANVLSGITIAGQAGTMPNRGAVTITPGTADQVISNGYHNGSGKVAGDADLKAENISENANIFGIKGTLEEKLDMSDYLRNIPDNRKPIGFIEGEGLWVVEDVTSAVCYDASGNLIKTVRNLDTKQYNPVQVTKNYILWTINYYMLLTDKNGTKVIENNFGKGIIFAIISESDELIYVSFTSNTGCYIYDLNLTNIHNVQSSAFTGTKLGAVLVKHGILLFCSSSDYSETILINSDGTIKIFRTGDDGHPEDIIILNFLWNTLKE